MTDLEILVKQTSNPSNIKMLQRLHEEVLRLGEMAIGIRSERDFFKAEAERHNEAANDLAKRCAHWIEKHDALLENQLQTAPVEWTDENVIMWCRNRGIQSAAIYPKDGKNCNNCEFHYKDSDMKPCNTCVRGNEQTDNWQSM